MSYLRITLARLFALLATIQLNAQHNNDDLQLVWLSDSQPDSAKVEHYAQHINSTYLRSQPDSAIILTKFLMDFLEERFND